MSLESHRTERGPQEPQKLQLPASEALLTGDRSDSCWPAEVLSDPSVSQEAERRRVLITQLDALYEKVPQANLELESALRSGLVREDEVADLHNSLAEFLEHGEGHDRLALYLPFELLPNRTVEIAPGSRAQASERFAEAYLRSWRSLLTTQDVRANFVDGDVLEAELRTEDLPRVVKAAHLIPKLAERQLLSSRDVIHLADHAQDDILRTSVADTLPVLADMHLLSDQALAALSRSKDPFFVNIAHTLASEELETKGRTEEQAAESAPAMSLERLEEELQAIRTHSWHGATEARAAWLRQEEERRAIERYAEHISPQIQGGPLAEEGLRQLASGGTSGALVFLRGARQALEREASADVRSAQAKFTELTPLFESLRADESPVIQSELVSTLCRLGSLHIIQDETLAQWDIVRPELSDPLSRNLENLEDEGRELSRMTEAIALNEHLSSLIYPVSLLFGSRLKGYGAAVADLDVAVFVKPGTRIELRPDLQSLLRDTFSHEKVGGKVVEFWLEETGDDLRVRDFDHTDSLLGESSWTHILFEAAWCGNKDVIRALHQKLLLPYLRPTEMQIAGRPARSVWLEEMERDALQYRLMHKGYSRFYPEQGGIHTLHSDSIDGTSTFWDSGYRRTATKLFLSRVFLPELDA